jgi:hypothetical protein
MSDPNAVEAATRRLAMALEALEAAVERRREADRTEQQLVAQLQAMGGDRSRLAADLDAAAAQAKRQDNASREIGRRLDVAIETIRAVIDNNDR